MSFIYHILKTYYIHIYFHSQPTFTFISYYISMFYIAFEAYPIQSLFLNDIFTQLTHSSFYSFSGPISRTLYIEVFFETHSVS